MSNYNNNNNSATNNSNLNQINVNNQNHPFATSSGGSSSAYNISALAGGQQQQQQQPQNNGNFVLQTLRRRATKVTVPLDERVTLERALGFTINANTRFAQSCDGLIAYLAGCVIVLYDSERQTQEFIISSARKTLTTVAFSVDGKCIATGEVNNLFSQKVKFEPKSNLKFRVNEENGANRI
jgi:hypothetical protein